MKKSVTTVDPHLPNSPVTEDTHPEEAETSRLTDKPILFFDGVCGLCNSSVDFAMARDRHARLYYAPLQGETARALLSEQDLAHVDTVIFRTAEGGRCYRRSAAVVRLLWLLGFPWNVCGGLLWCIPLPLRNLGYRMIASVRYRLFGKHETCRMPSSEERARLLP